MRRIKLFRSATIAASALLLGAVLRTWNIAQAEPATSKPPTAPIETLPASRGGQDLTGTAFPDLHFGRWLNTNVNKPLDIADSVTLYRWWTDTCPYCAATLPAIEKLRGKYADRGFKVVAVYHPKPPREVKDESVLASADRIGYKGPIAIDADWAQLRKVWLTPGRRAATSVTLLVDRHCVIRFVHPGVEFFPSDKPEASQENSDFILIDKAIDTLLKEGPAK